MVDLRSTSILKNSTTIAKQKFHADAKSSQSPRKPNLIWKYIGFGKDFHPHLPSRNWILFLCTVGLFTAAVIYDKREKKRKQIKWCKLVEHIAKQPLESRTMPRKLTVFLEAPPMDGLRSAQDHFKEYVKPILVSSGLDWEFVQGTKEGEIWTKVAERIRNSRLPPEELSDKDDITRFRKKNGIKNYEGPGGDIVIGRHTWKEYVRGLHEGWLGPLTNSSNLSEAPHEGQEEISSNTSPKTFSASNISQNSIIPAFEPKATDYAQNLSLSTFQPSSLSYSMTPLPDEIPSNLEPSIPVPFPHVLGFLNAPKRIYRFLNRRNLADSIGRETAAAILSAYRPYHISKESSFSNFSGNVDNLKSDFPSEYSQMEAEQQIVLQDEEKEWHKSLWEGTDERLERPWLCPIILDSRIASRMRRFDLSPEEEERAKNIEISEEEIEGWIKGCIRKVLRVGKRYLEINEA